MLNSKLAQQKWRKCHCNKNFSPCMLLHSNVGSWYGLKSVWSIITAIRSLQKQACNSLYFFHTNTITVVQLQSPFLCTALTEDQCLIVLYIKGIITLLYAVSLPNYISSFYIDCWIPLFLTFFCVSYLHHLIFLICRLKYGCDFIKNIEYFTVKVDFRTLFSIPLIY